MTASRLGLLIRTIVHLRLRQVAARAQLRGQRALLSQAPGVAPLLLRPPSPDQMSGWPAGYLPLDGRAISSWPRRIELEAGRIRLLGVERGLRQPGDWMRPEDPQLWRYHLQYWDWAWGLVADADRAISRQLFARLWRSWRSATTLGQADAWHPYPASLRAWSWCGQFEYLVRGSDIEDDFVSDLALHAAFVRRFLEVDVGGNHLMKNLKAVIGLALFFGDDRQLRQSVNRMVSQVGVQVLSDGGHYERAPAYHCQVLADLTDVVELLQAAGRTPPEELDRAISRMRGWLRSAVLPDGTVPMMNDGFPVEPGLLAALVNTVLSQLEPRAPLHILSDTGLTRATVGDWQVLADVGDPCPRELPAHAHADSLNCIVNFRGQPLLIDTGTSTYAAGPVRDYERSTAAHNTVEIDDADSTEVWGAFRAARRARIKYREAYVTPAGVVIAAAHDGYRAVPGRPLHHRRWLLTGDRIEVEDRVTGRGRHRLAVRWHLASGLRARVTDSGADISVPGGLVSLMVTSSVAATLSIETNQAATGFECTTAVQTLICRLEAQLPVAVTTSWCGFASNAALSAAELVPAEETR